MLLRTPSSGLRDIEPILVIGGSHRTLDLLRVAVLRSDDIVAVVPHPDDQTSRYAAHFAVDLIDHWPDDLAMTDLAAALISIGDIEEENRWVRDARRHRLPIHVADRPLVSDFTLLDFLEQRPLSLQAA